MGEPRDYRLTVALAGGPSAIDTPDVGAIRDALFRAATEAPPFSYRDRSAITMTPGPVVGGVLSAADWRFDVTVRTGGEVALVESNIRQALVRSGGRWATAARTWAREVPGAAAVLHVGADVVAGIGEGLGAGAGAAADLLRGAAGTGSRIVAGALAQLWWVVALAVVAAGVVLAVRAALLGRVVRAVA